MKKKHKIISKQKRSTSSIKMPLEYILVLLIIAITTVVFIKTTNYDFTNWDDNTYIHDNISIQSINTENVKTIFTQPFFNNYHPLTTLTYALEIYFFGYNPSVFHINNLWLHLINTLLVFFLIKAFTKKKYAPALVALIFALHPLHAESVVWISERKDLLYAAFFLSALLSYVRFIKENKKILYFFLSLFLFICALLSKSAAVTLPLILILTIWHFKGRINIKQALYTTPFFILSLIFGVIALKSQGNAIANINEMFPGIHRILLVLYVLSVYIFKFIFPLHSSSFHPFPDEGFSGLSPVYYATPLFIILLVGLAFFLKKDIRNKYIFGLLFFLLTILPVVQIVPLGSAIIAERYTYIPYIGLAFFLAELVNFLVLKFKPLPTFLILIIWSFFLIYQCAAALLPWENSETLWSSVIVKYPQSHLAFNNRANARFNTNNLQGAIADYSKAIELNPNNAASFNNRANAKKITGDYTGALADYTQALILNPGVARVYNNRADTKIKIGDNVGAVADLDTAVSLNPNFTGALLNRGLAYQNLGNWDAAKQDYAKVISIDSTYAQAHYNMAIVEQNNGDINKAITAYSKAIELKSDFQDALFNRGIAYCTLNNFKQGISDFDRLINTNAHYPQAYYNRATAKNLSGDIMGACTDWAIALQNGNNNAQIMLQNYCN